MSERPLSSLATDVHSLNSSKWSWRMTVSITLNIPGRSPISFLKLSRAINEVSPLTTRSHHMKKEVWWLRIQVAQHLGWEMEYEKVLHYHNPGTSWVQTSLSPLCVMIHILARTDPIFFFFHQGWQNLKQVDSSAFLKVSYWPTSYYTGKKKSLQFLSSGLRTTGSNHPGRGEWNLPWDGTLVLMLRIKDKGSSEGTGLEILEVEGNPEIRLWWDNRQK